jgi:thiol-disulfide isomerase/thioredoxin
MRFVCIHLLLILFPALLVSGQRVDREPQAGTFTIEGRVYLVPDWKMTLATVFGEKVRIVDSAFSDKDGNFTFVLKPVAPIGLYRITWAKDKFVDLLWNKENIRFFTRSDSPLDSLQILSSVENSIYYQYMKLDRKAQEKLDLLMPIIDYYPEENDFYEKAVVEFESSQRGMLKIQDSINDLYPNLFALRIIKNQSTPFLSASLSKDERINYLKTHFFDKVNFQDTLLLNSNAWANKSISYLSLYGNSKLDQKQLEAEFIKAVTIMLSAAAVNKDIYKFILDYVVGGFDKYHFDGVITYIADNFQDPFSCEDQERKTALQKKLDNFKKLSIGKKAPEIESTDAKGKMAKLSAIQSEYTLVIFWSSECGHCAEMMPKIKQIYDNQKPKRMEIYSVSIDTSKVEWTTFLKEEKLNWINVSDLKGFNSKSADDYNIFATPTMFLLDKEKNIIAKPVSYRELEQDLKNNKLL